MEFEKIEQLLVNALCLVVNSDSYLLEKDVNEPTISHRLAMYLEFELDDFVADCEYNRNIDVDNGQKYVHLLKEEAEALNKKLKEDDADSEQIQFRVYPDIIIHKRGQSDSENNLLVIEVKKTSNSDSGDWDRKKLSKFTSREQGNNFKYQYGAFVKFIVGKKPDFSIEWYKEGARFQ